MALRSRNTRQKDELENAVFTMNTQFTADDLAQRLPHIGTATIYRWLATQRTTGRLHAFTCSGKTIYSTHKTSHSHFICERCGHTTHLNITKLDFLNEHVHGTICHVQIDITGICTNCRQTGQAKQPRAL